MLLKIRRFAVASAIVIPGLVGLSVATASAAPAAHFASVRQTHVLGTGPNTDLTGSGSTVVFNPHKLKNLASVSSADCSTSDYTFSVDNTTSASQTLTYMGTSTGITIPSGDEYAICFTGSPGKYKLGLSSSPAAKLKLKVTS